MGRPGIFIVFPIGARICCRAGTLVDFPLAHAAAASWAKSASRCWRHVDRAGDAFASGLVYAIRLVRAGHACPNLSNQAFGGHGHLPPCAQSHVRRSRVGDSRAGSASRECARPGLRSAGLAGFLSFCGWLRGAHVAPHFWRGVREILRAGSTLDSPLTAVAWRVKDRQETCQTPKSSESS